MNVEVTSNLCCLTAISRTMLPMCDVVLLTCEIFKLSKPKSMYKTVSAITKHYICLNYWKIESEKGCG